MGKLLSFLGQPSAASSKSRPTRWRTHYTRHRLGLMSPRGLIHNNKGRGRGWTYVEDFWCHFIQNTTSLDLHNSMEHVIFYSVSALLRKQRPEKLLNRSKGRMWTQTSASRAGWHLWYSWTLGNGRVTDEECHVIPGRLLKAKCKYSQWKIKAWPACVWCLIYAQ